MAVDPRKVKRGRYQDWLTEDGLLQIEGWARDGLTNKDIAGNIGVHDKTFATWISKYPEIREAVRKGKAPADVKVENAFFKRATGEWVEETDTIIEQTGNRPPTKKIIKKKKYIPPDTTAGIFWLKNRKPSKWQRVSEAEYRKLISEARRYEMEVMKLEKELEELDAMKEARVVIVDSWEQPVDKDWESIIEKDWDEKLKNVTDKDS